MKRGPATLCASLLVLSLLLVYLTWTGNPGPASDERIVILDLKPDDITTLRLISEAETVELTRAESDWWVTVVDRSRPERATRGNHEEAGRSAAGETGEPPHMVSEPGPRRDSQAPGRREFRANRRARDLVARFAPLEAARDLGTLPPEGVGEFGFEPPKQRLVVIYEDGEAAFDVGGRPDESAYVYVRRRSDGRVYLTLGDPLFELGDSEARLLDRHLHSFSFSDVDRAVVIAGGRRREFVRRAGEDAPPHWVDVAEPQKSSEFYARWLLQTHQLDVKELIPFDRRAMPSTSLVTIEYYRGPNKQGRLELSWEPAGRGGIKHLCARSEHTLRWVRVGGAGAEAVARDLDEVLSQ